MEVRNKQFQGKKHLMQINFIVIELFKQMRRFVSKLHDLKKKKREDKRKKDSMEGGPVTQKHLT